MSQKSFWWIWWLVTHFLWPWSSFSSRGRDIPKRGKNLAGISQFSQNICGKIFLIISGEASRYEFLFVSILKIFLVFLTSGKKTQYILKTFSEKSNIQWKIKHSVKNQTFNEKSNIQWKIFPVFHRGESPLSQKHLPVFGILLPVGTSRYLEDSLRSHGRFSIITITTKFR